MRFSTLTRLVASAFLAVAAGVCVGAEPAQALAVPYSTYAATAPTASLGGAIRHVRVNPLDGKAYVLGASTSVLGVFNADGSSFTTASYDVALPSHSSSDMVFSNGRVFLTIGGAGTFAAYRYDVSGSVASLVASDAMSSGATSIAYNGESDLVYVNRGSAVQSYDASMTRVAPTTTLVAAPSRMAYAQGTLFYLTSAGSLRKFTALGTDYVAVNGTNDLLIASSIVSGGSIKGLAASSDGQGLYYASTTAIGKRSASGSVLWSRSVSSVADFDVNATSGRITVINTSGAVSTYDPINPVSGVTATASGTSVLLGWTPGVSDSDFGGVTIRRSTGGYPVSATDGDAVTSSTMLTSLTDADLGEGTYYYSFFNKTSDGYYGAAATSTVTIDLPPSAPVLAAGATGNVVSLSWSVPATTASFVLRRGTSGYPATLTDGTMVTSTDASVISLSETGLADGVYYFSVFALDAGGNASEAGTAMVMVDTIAPAAPVLSALANGSTVSLSWDTPATAEAFLLRRSTVAFPSGISDGIAVTSTVLTGLVLTAQTDGTHYYALFARDGFGNYSTAGTASVTIDTVSPLPPSGVSAVADGDTVRLAWSNPPDPDFASVIIRRGTTGFPASATDGAAVATTASTAHADASRANGTYYYSLFAQDATGNLSNAATASVTVSVTAAEAPVVSGGGGGGSVSVAPSAMRAAPLSFSVSGGSSANATVTVASPTVQLRLNADPATVRGYAVSLDPAFKDASIFPLAPSGNVTFALPNEAGTYQVYLKYFSTTGHGSDPIVQTVSFAPTASSGPSVGPTVPSPGPDPAPTFARTLRSGDRGADVKALQVFLNAHGFIVAKTGAGSPNRETTLLGPATVNAIKKFQEAYKDIILKPYGLEKGTGIFGAKMRELINSMR